MLRSTSYTCRVKMSDWQKRSSRWELQASPAGSPTVLPVWRSLVAVAPRDDGSDSHHRNVNQDDIQAIMASFYALRQHRLHHLSMHIGEPVVAALEAVDEALMVNAHQVHD